MKNLYFKIARLRTILSEESSLGLLNKAKSASLALFPWHNTRNHFFIKFIYYAQILP